MKTISRFMVILTVLVSMLALVVSCSDDDDDDSNGVTPSTFTPDGMVLINSSGNSFDMGAESGMPDEAPVHAVSFTCDFWMDTTEVTQADFTELMTEAYSDYIAPDWHEPYGVGDDTPAYNLSWGDAVLYCNARSQRDGLDEVYSYSGITGTPGSSCELSDLVCDYTLSGYRLPTEAEWEYAYRAGTTTDLYWGQDLDPYPATSADSAEVGTYAFWYGNSYIFGSEVDAFGTQPVGGKEPNAFGLYDMAGNVFEYCNDWYGEYSETAAVDPTGPETGDFHIMRGGSWGNNAFHMRASNRTLLCPDYIYYFIGFRAVLPDVD